MNAGLKNKLMVMAAAAGLAGFGVACSGEGESPAAADEGVETTTGGEASCSAAVEEGANDEAAEEEGGEAACGAGSCGG